MVVYRLAVQMHEDRGKQGVWGWAGEDPDDENVFTCYSPLN